MSASGGALLTDLYQLTMLHGYFERGMEEEAVFEFFVRDLPEERGFLVAAGLEQVLEYLQTLRFTDEDLRWLAAQGNYPSRFIDYLRDFRFAGDIHAMPEGTVFFAQEPVLRVCAPLPQAQFVESRLLNLLHFQTLIASKAARCALAAPGKFLVDFGMRRSHGAEAALLAARASYLAGFAGTSTVLANPRFGIPVFGTMAHSYVMVHESEAAAFEHFAHCQPDNVVLLIDTYDTEAAARKVAALVPRLAERGIAVKAVRLDSGDLADHARRVRAILDEAGHPGIHIFASGNLDEYALQDIARADAPIDGFGVGTKLDTSGDHPYLDCAYKLQEYAGTPRRKRSEGKSTLPGRKQVYRRLDGEKRMCGDEVTLEREERSAEALLEPVMRRGHPLRRRDLGQARELCRLQLAALPTHLADLDTAPAYPVGISPELLALAEEIDRIPT